MVASPYVRPFAEEVRQWEQRLSLISETIEVRSPGSRRCGTHMARPTQSVAVQAALNRRRAPHSLPHPILPLPPFRKVWLAVQRRWMYLESIFVGSDDIRHQLPQEAKRFDNIDRCSTVDHALCLQRPPAHNAAAEPANAAVKRKRACPSLLRSWQAIMTDTSKNTLVLDACSSEGRRVCRVEWSKPCI
jgi:dynein heavy chain, axonemal